MNMILNNSNPTFVKLRCLLKLECVDFVYIFIAYLDFVCLHFHLFEWQFVENFRNQMN